MIDDLITGPWRKRATNWILGSRPVIPAGSFVRFGGVKMSDGSSSAG